MAKFPLHLSLQFMDVQLARIDHLVGESAHILQGLPFTADPFLDRSGAGQRVRPARLVESAQPNVVRSIKENNLNAVAGGADFGQDVGPGLEKLTAAQIHAERDAPRILAVAVAKIDEFRDQRGGEIIDAEETFIFQGANRNAFSGTGKPGYDDNIETIGHTKLEFLILFSDGLKDLLARFCFHQ